MHDVVTGTGHVCKVNLAAVKHEIEVGTAEAAQFKTLCFGIVVCSASPCVFKDAQWVSRPLIGSGEQSTGEVIEVAPFFTRCIYHI